MNGDFIILNRKFENWEWSSSPNMVAVFIRCLLKANYKDLRFQGHEVPRGSFVLSQESFAKECGLSRQQLRTCLKKLEETGEITRKSTSKFTIISVCNYCKYQDYQPTDNQQVTTRETKEQEIIIYSPPPQGINARPRVRVRTKNYTRRNAGLKIRNTARTKSPNVFPKKRKSSDLKKKRKGSF